MDPVAVAPVLVVGDHLRGRRVGGRSPTGDEDDPDDEEDDVDDSGERRPPEDLHLPHRSRHSRVIV